MKSCCSTSEIWPCPLCYLQQCVIHEHNERMYLLGDLNFSFAMFAWTATTLDKGTQQGGVFDSTVASGP